MNSILFVFGPVLLGLACWIRFSSDWSAYFNDPVYGYTALHALMALGGFIMLVAMIGLCGACREKKRYLFLYAFTIIIALASYCQLASNQT